MGNWPPPLERFEAKVTRSPDSDCWTWTGGKKEAGYGQFQVDGHKVIAHRWAYEHFVGPIPDAYEVDHTCFNRGCVNPDHLEAVTLRENRDRRIGRKTHCPQRHAYTPDNTLWQMSKGYRSRYCRTCNAAKQRKMRRARTGG